MNQFPRVCYICKQFYGTEKQEWLCSKCYQLANKPEPKVNLAPEPSATSIPESNNANLDISKEAVSIRKEAEKCSKCLRKVGFLGYKCACESTFCRLHRMPEDHECRHDFVTELREKIARENPIVKGSRVDKI